MIPILYKSTETEFTSNGLGRLSDAISCTVEEERNGAYELTMEYPVYGVHYKDLQNTQIIVAVPSDGADRQPFDIYDISRPISGKVTVKARHISYRLSRIPTYSKNPDETSGTAALALQRLKSEALENCPFDFWTDQNSQGSYSTPVPASIRSRLGGVTGSILDCFGGEYEWDEWTVKLWKARGSETSIVLRYGKNITDITQEESIENTVTGVLPYWHKEADSNAEAQTVIGSIVYAANADKYPYHMTMVLDCSQEYQTAPTAAQLSSRAQAYIKSNDIGVPDVSISLSFVALWQSEEYKTLTVLERVHLCDTLRVEFPALGVSATAKVVKTTYNVLKNRYDSIEIGNARTSLADQITGTSKDTEIRQKQSLSFLQEALARSTKLIQGGLGGHVLINTDGDGKPNEILIMDTDDTATASKVLRINMNGIGFSSKGYEGPFSTAWTIDGVFNADYINAGTIRANLIKAGILSDVKGINFWNLETGEFQLSANTRIGDSLVATVQDVNTVQSSSVKSVEVEYAQGDSQTTAPTTGWSSASPTWAQGQYIWSRTKTTNGDGTVAYTEAVCVSGAKGDKGEDGPKGDTGATGTGVSAIVTEYALTASSTSTSDATWSTSEPAWESGKYIWTRSRITWTDGSTTYTDPVLANAINAANEQAAAANALAQAVQKEADKKVQVFYSATAPTSDMDVGDLWIDTDDNQMYRYSGIAWLSVQDSSIQDALTKAGKAQKTADKKIVCTASATAPSGATDGDLWIQTANSMNSDGSIKAYSGAIWRYSTGDSRWHTWFDMRSDALADAAEAAAKKYADSQDSALNTTIMSSLTQQEIFNRLTNNGQTQGIYLQDGLLYINGSYIKSGTMDAGLIKTGALLVGGTGKVSKVLLYSSGNLQFGSIGSDGIFVSGDYLSIKTYLDLRPDIFSGMRVSHNSDFTGNTLMLTPDGIAMTSKGSSSAGLSLSINCVKITPQKVAIIGDTLADARIILDANSGLYVDGNLSKSGVIDTEDYGSRALYCYEMASPTYGDIGEGEIGEDGSAYIQLDPVFSECILTDQYQVFLQPYGDGKCYVKERHSTYFVVSGTSGLSFGWELKAKNRDYNLKRLNTFDPIRAGKDNTDYGGEAQNHIEQITKERS